MAFAGAINGLVMSPTGSRRRKATAPRRDEPAVPAVLPARRGGSLDLPRSLDDGPVDERTTKRKHGVAGTSRDLPKHFRRPLDLFTSGPKGLVGHAELFRVDAQLSRKAEVPAAGRFAPKELDVIDGERDGVDRR